jgi:hypothetical protein
MIQRIQTLYLLLVVILGTLLCIFSPVEFLLPGATDYVSLHALDKWPLAVMSIAIPLLALVTIGMYKRRLLQVRLNIMNVVLCLGYYALLALYVAYIVKGYEPLGAVNCQLSTVNCQLSTVNCEWYLTMWSAIPLVNVVLTMMATRRILKDEALVRAADRLR